jgi:hypothetical protein
MKTKIILFLTITFIALKLNAQELKHSLTLEIGGGGFFYSVNYEYFLKRNFIARAGTSFLLIKEKKTEKSLKVMSIPLSISYLQNIHHNKHYFEIGIGTMDLITSGDLIEYKGVTDIFLNPFLITGYRYRPMDKKWNFKLSLTPFYGTRSLINLTEQGFRPFGSKFQVWGNIGFGYNF